MAFTATNKAPGVYIDEIQLPGPIPGVGTSTVAIVGPAKKGPLRTPTFLTNLTQFAETFGAPVDTPPVYAPHAVHGYFGNGGASCYFVRVGTAKRASRVLMDSAAKGTVVVTAKNEGTAANTLGVKVTSPTTAQPAKAKLVKVEADVTAGAAGDPVLTVNDVSGFLVGDVVRLDKAPDTERGTIDSIDTGAKKIRLKNAATKDYSGGKVRIGDLVVGQKRIRVNDSKEIYPGSHVKISQSGGNNEQAVVGSIEGPPVHALHLTKGLTKTYSLATGDSAVEVETLEFDLEISPPGEPTEKFTHLAMDPLHPRYYARAVASSWVEVAPADDPPNTTPPPGNIPVTASHTLAGGADDDLSAVTVNDYLTAIDSLQKVDEVTLLAVPDAVGFEQATDTQTIQQKMIDHCQAMQDRFAILDSRRGAGPSNGILTQLGDLNPSDRGFAALYYPWIVINNPAPSGGRLQVPPSGHVAGVFARTDDQRGVHKAPANEVIQGVLALERTLADDEQGPLNEKGINVLRSFPARGIRIWGARTIKSSTQWRYVNVRRLLLFIEESIQEGTQFAVFEPNNLTLWQTLKHQVSEFLLRVWQDGGLVGATPEQAFRVRIDEELNPPAIRALGQLIIEVRVAPTTPAEFVVFRIIQQPGRPIVDE